MEAYNEKVIYYSGNDGTELVSIICCSYKKFEHIFVNLKSIMRQDYARIEIIFADDGSDKFPLEEIKSFLAEHNKGNLVRAVFSLMKQNEGSVKNANRAISICNGQYVIPLTPDDTFYDNSSISKIVTAMRENNTDIITTFRMCCTEDTFEELYKLPQPYFVSQMKTNSPSQIYALLCEGNFISGAGTFYTAKFFEKYELFDESYVLLEDYPKYLSITSQGCKIIFCDFISIKYRLGGISTSEKRSPILEADNMTLVRKEILPFYLRTNKYQYNIMSRRLSLNGTEVSRACKCLYVMKNPDAAINRVFFKVKRKILKIKLKLKE